MNKRRFLDGILAFFLSFGLMFAISFVSASIGGIWMLILPEAALIIVPILLTKLRKEKVAERCSLKVPSIRSFFGSVIIVFGANALQNAASFLYYAVFGETSTTDLEMFEYIFGSGINPYLVLIAIAVIPAIAEEFLFRGYILNSFKTEKSAVWGVVLSGVLFSCMHLDLYKALPILILGLAFGYIAAKTGSILIPIIFHFINNAMSVISYYQMSNSAEEQMYMVFGDAVYVCFAAAAVGFGTLLVYFGTRILSHKQRKKALTVFVVIISVILMIAGVIGGALSMISVGYDGTFSQQLRQDTVHTEKFTLDKNAMGTVNAMVIADKTVNASVTVTDEEGDIVYDYEDIAMGQVIMLKKGEYTVTYEFDLDDNSTVAHDVMAAVQVVTIGEYSEGEDFKS